MRNVITRVSGVLLLLFVIHHPASCQIASNELGRVEQFQAELKAEESVFSHPTTLDMPRFTPIPAKCMDDMLRKADAVYQRHVARRRRSFRDPDRPSVKDMDEVEAVFFRPTYPCSLEQRVGDGGDGGKWICRGTRRMQDVQRGELAVVSIGSRGVTCFEQDMNRIYGCVTDTFDPFMPGPSLAVVDKLPFMKMHTTGLLGTREAEEWQAGPQARAHRMVSLSELLQIIEKERVDVFKIDCESCEYGFSDDLAGVRASSQVLGQILMEVHYHNDTERFTRLALGLESVGYRMFHAENNPYSMFAYEVAFIHESQLLPSEYGVAEELSPKDDEACYAAFARQADAIFNANWARKQKRFIDRGQPEIIQHLKWTDVIAFFMMGDYPCQLYERFGVWGKGGATVCLRHKPSCPGLQTENSQGVIVTIGGPGSDAGSKSLLFEEELAASIGATTHIFNSGLGTDMLYPRESDSRPSIHYHDRNVCGPRFAALNNVECIGLKQMLDLVRVETVQVLRIDCKGCEFELVSEMEALYFADPSSVPFGQILLRASQHRLTQPILRTLGLMGYRLFIAEQSLKEFEVSLIHNTCL